MKKNKGGRPPIFKSEKVLKNRIDKYFDTGIPERTFVVGGKNKRVVIVEVPTITGLIRFLGFNSRQSFYNYKKKNKFSYAVNRAVLKIEMTYEQQLLMGLNCTGAIFALKSLGWTGKTQTNQSD